MGLSISPYLNLLFIIEQKNFLGKSRYIQINNRIPNYFKAPHYIRTHHEIFY